MSINMDIKSPSKRELAEILRRIADLIETASNKTVTVRLDVTFNKEDC